jgi:hypothetical protein
MKLVDLALLAILAVPLACAAPCERVEASHTAFRRATARPQARPGAAAATPARDSGAHLSASIPYELIDAMIAKQLDQIPKLKLPLGSISGVALGTVQLGVEAVRARSAPDGQLGFRIRVGLREGKREVMSVDIDAQLRPRLDPRSGSLAVALAGRDIVSLTPSISAQSRKQLGEWIWAQLPPAAKLVVDRATVSNLAGELAERLMKQAAGMLERELLDDLGELARFEFDLPEALPVQALELRASERYLDLDLRTGLPVEIGLPAGRERVEGLHPNLVQIRVAGDALAALANHAIQDGRIPSRWTLEGEPDPEGEIWAGLAWAEGTPDPIEVHLWKRGQAGARGSECAHVVLRGEPHLQVVSPARGSPPQLELGARGLEVESVVGSAKIRAGLFFSRAARRGVELIERTTAATEIEIANQPLSAQVRSAEVRGDEVVLGLTLVPRR